MDYLKSLNELKKEHQSYHSSKLRKLYDTWYSETFGENKIEHQIDLLIHQKDFVNWVIKNNPDGIVTITLSGWMFEPIVCVMSREDRPIVLNPDWSKDARIFTGNSDYHIPYKIYEDDIWYTIFTVEHWPELIPFSILAL